MLSRHPRVALLPFYNMTQPRFDLHEAGFCAFEGLRGKKPTDPPPYCWSVARSQHHSERTDTPWRAATAHTIVTHRSCGRLSFTTCSRRTRRQRKQVPDVRKHSMPARTSIACAEANSARVSCMRTLKFVAGQGKRRAAIVAGLTARSAAAPARNVSYQRESVVLASIHRQRDPPGRRGQQARYNVLPGAVRACAYARQGRRDGRGASFWDLTQLMGSDMGYMTSDLRSGKPEVYRHCAH